MDSHLNNEDNSYTLRDLRKIPTYNLMIDFTRNGNTVYVTVETGLSTDPKISFRFDASSSLCAELLHEKLWIRFMEMVENVRKEEYNAGWRDKTKRLAKCQYFYSTLNPKKS